MKRVLCTLLAVLLAFGQVLDLSANAEQTEITVKLDGETLTFDQQPIMQQDRVLVPMRVIFEALGCTVGWEESTRTASAEKDGVAIYLQIGNEIMYRNGEEVLLDVAPCQVGDRTLVPIRAVSEALGASVTWEQYANCVTIFSAEYQENPPLELQTAYLDCIGKKPAEVAAVFGPVSDVEGPVQSAIFYYRDGVWVEYDGARPGEDGQIVPIDGAVCISIRGPLSTFLPGMPERLSEGEAALYFGKLHLEYAAFMDREALVHTGDKYTVYIAGTDDGNGVYPDSTVWVSIGNEYYLDVIGL